MAAAAGVRRPVGTRPLDRAGWRWSWRSPSSLGCGGKLEGPADLPAEPDVRLGCADVPPPALGTDQAAYPRGGARAVDQLAAEVEQDPVGGLVPGFQRFAWVAAWVESGEPVAERRVERGVGLLTAAVLRAGTVTPGRPRKVGREVAQPGP